MLFLTPRFISSRFMCSSRPIHFKFVGEEGVDAGGVTKEFFLLAMRAAFDLNAGLFVSARDNEVVWFNGAADDPGDRAAPVAAADDGNALRCVSSGQVRLGAPQVRIQEALTARHRPNRRLTREYSKERRGRGVY